ncbi:MAG: Hsp20 family protein [Bacilli bacterium]|nr:Hsp20 family protein [Bacilli bacterium]
MFDLISRKRNFISDIIPDSLVFSLDKNMRLNIKETDLNYEFEVELPGVKRDDITVTYTDDVLTISVKKEEEVNEETSKYIRKERKFGSFSRSFSLPNVNSELITANYQNGLLKIIAPKKEKVEKPLKIINIE